MSSATARSTAAIFFASRASGCLPRRYVVDTSSSSLIRSSTISIISSGFLRDGLAAATVGGGSRIRTWSACAPRRPSATPNSTRCPCRSDVVPAGSADECTNTSPPSSRARKPYPLSESYHLTLPVGTHRPHVERTKDNQRSGDRQDAIGISKAIGPGRRIAASLSPVAAFGRPGRAYRSYGPSGFAWPPGSSKSVRPATHRTFRGRSGNEPGQPNGPGEDPGRLVDSTSVDQKSMSPPPPGAAGAGFFSGFSTITASVVRNRPAIDAAFCSADLVTFAGSMMPALNMSTYSPVAASRP